MCKGSISAWARISKMQACSKFNIHFAGEDLSIFREIGENLLMKSCKIGVFCLKLRKFRRIHAKNGLFSFLSRGKFINLPNPAGEN